MRKRSELLLLALCVDGALVAQAPRWSAEMPLVHEAGLHAIALSPEMLGASRSDLGDIRIVDAQGVDVPYVLREVATPGDHGRFIPFQLVRNEVRDRVTVLELERPADQELEALHIWIRPTETEKQVRITGSDDRHEWYMVKDEHLVAQGARGDPPHQVLTVRLPRNDYRFLRLTLNDSVSAPLNVLGVGRFADGETPGWRYVETPSLSFVQADSARESRLSLALGVPLLAERLAFRVSDTGLYRRDARLEARRRATMRKGHHAVPMQWTERLADDVIASDRAAFFDMAPARIDTFDLVVSNGDDRPLRFVDIRILARERVLLARLEPDTRYRLFTGNAELEPPRYDIAHFADELPVPLDTLRHGALTAIPEEAEVSPGFNPSSGWVWGAIIVLMLSMGAVAARLLKQER